MTEQSMNRESFERLDGRVESAKKTIDYYSEICKKPSTESLDRKAVKANMTDDQLKTYVKGMHMLKINEASAEIRTSPRGMRSVVIGTDVIGGFDSQKSLDHRAKRHILNNKIMDAILGVDDNEKYNPYNILDDTSKITTIDGAKNLISEMSEEKLAMIGRWVLADYMVSDIRRAMYPDM